MKRRHFLGATISTVGTSILAGCADNEVKDTDGDGVIDSEDYAPRDPEVQKFSDVANPKTETPTSTETPTHEENDSTVIPAKSTPTSTPTDTPTPESKIVSGRVESNYQNIRDMIPSYFKWYSPTKAKLHINTSTIEEEKLEDRMELLLIVQRYPNKSIIDNTRSNAFTPPEKGEVTVSYDRLSLPNDGHYMFTALLVPADTSTDELNQGNAHHLADTDRLTTENYEMVKDKHPDSKESIETDEYTRVVGEGVYGIKTTGQNPFRIIVYKAAYIEQSNKPFQRTSEVIHNSIQDGVADSLASITANEAEERGYTSSRQKVNYAVASIQPLPYVKDRDDYDDYSKYPIETLVEGGGDCEDTTILLSATLSGEGFKYGNALIWLPPQQSTHIALGVKGSDDVRGSYYEKDGVKYYFVETTGRGWELGEIPPKYQDMKARVEPILS